MIVFMLALQFTHRTDNTNMPSFIILMRSSHNICDYVCIAYMCVCKCMLRINVCLTKNGSFVTSKEIACENGN